MSVHSPSSVTGTDLKSTMIEFEHASAEEHKKTVFFSLAVNVISRRSVWLQISIENHWSIFCFQHCYMCSHFTVKKSKSYPVKSEVMMAIFLPAISTNDLIQLILFISIWKI